MIKNSLIILALSLNYLSAATLSWEDTNNLIGTRYVISNKLNNGPWLWLANTTNKSNIVTLVPGTNWFSVTVTNGLLSDPAVTNGNVPFKVFNIIIEAKNDLNNPSWKTLTNIGQLVVTVKEMEFYRIRATIE